MKSNKILLAILIVLVAASIFFVATSDSGTIDEIEGAKSDFAIEDTSSITKIFIVDAKGKKVTLSKLNDVWMVNNKYVARPDNIRLLMKTFSRIEVKAPVPRAAINNKIKDLATNATKVEIYTGGKTPEKIYYVGGPTINHQGTYMLLESEGVKSTVPFVMHIPGFYGYLSTRFFTEAAQWRDAVVFKYLPEQIKNISVKYFENPEESFILENQNNKFVLKDFTTGEAIDGVDTTLVKQYVNLYQKIYYEMIDEEATPEKIDSVISSQPYFSIEVKDFVGNGDKIVAYHMPNYRELLDHKGEPFMYDVDRMYGYLNNELFLFIQFATFDKITLPKSHFLIKSS